MERPMRNMRFAAVLAFSFVLTACDSPASREIAAPDHATPIFNEVPDGGIGLSFDGPFDQVLAAEDPSAQQVEPGGRASGHVGFNRTILTIANEKYSFNARGTDPPPPFAASGEYQLHLETTTGTTNKVHGTVICLGRVGNQARIGGVIDKVWVNNVQLPILPGTIFNFWTVTDNGEGNKDPSDLASLFRFSGPAAALAHCAVGIPLEQVPPDEGNVQVSSR
jgi:hypothetical protein